MPASFLGGLFESKSFQGIYSSFKFSNRTTYFPLYDDGNLARRRSVLQRTSYYNSPSPSLRKRNLNVPSDGLVLARRWCNCTSTREEATPSQYVAYWMSRPYSTATDEIMTRPELRSGHPPQLGAALMRYSRNCKS